MREYNFKLYLVAVYVESAGPRGPLTIKYINLRSETCKVKEHRYQLYIVTKRTKKGCNSTLTWGGPVDACAKATEGLLWLGVGGRRQAGWLPLTCSLAVYLTSAAGLLATHVKSPEWRESRLEMLRRLE